MSWLLDWLWPHSRASKNGDTSIEQHATQLTSGSGASIITSLKLEHSRDPLTEQSVERCREQLQAVRKRVQQELSRLIDTPRVETPSKSHHSSRKVKFERTHNSSASELRSKEKAVSSPMRFIAPSDLPSDFAANSGMQWDEERKEWRGNQVDLLGFSSNATMHKSIQRITDFTALYGAHQPIYHPSGMRFDPEKLVWVSPPGDSTADIFALDSPRSNSSLDSSASDDPSSQAMDPEVIQREFTLTPEYLETLKRQLEYLKSDRSMRCLKHCDPKLPPLEEKLKIRDLVMDALVNIALGQGVSAVASPPSRPATTKTSGEMKPETKAKLKAFQETMLDSDDDFSEGLEPLESTDKMKMILNEPKETNPEPTSAQPTLEELSFADESEGLDFADNPDSLKEQLSRVQQQRGQDLDVDVDVDNWDD